MSDRAFIIGYDIADPRRLQRVHREMCKHGSPLEYSVFLLVGNDRDKDRCMKRMAALIDAAKDDVRCYALPVRGFQGRIGLSGLPEGILWTGLPAAMS